MADRWKIWKILENVSSKWAEFSISTSRQGEISRYDRISLQDLKSDNIPQRGKDISSNHDYSTDVRSFLSIVNIGKRGKDVFDQLTCISSRRPGDRRGGRCSMWSCWPSTRSDRAPWSPPSGPTPPQSSSSRCPACPSWCGSATRLTTVCPRSHCLKRVFC